eukprot:scaffold617150_cov32-Prasinocladus_malaysianus.AAC.1
MDLTCIEIDHRWLTLPFNLSTRSPNNAERNSLSWYGADSGRPNEDGENDGESSDDEFYDP